MNRLLLLLSFLIFSCTPDENLENKPPTGFTISVNEIKPTTAKISWTESKDPEGGEISYDLYLDGNLLVQDITALEYSITGLTKETTYSGKIVAKNAFQKTTEASFSFKTNSLFTNLKAHYDFCGNADDQIGSNNGLIVGSVMLTQDRKGNENCAYQFPGTENDYIEIPYSEDFDFPINGSFSISLWYQGGSEDIGDLELFIVKENELATYGKDYHVGLYDCNNVTFMYTWAVINDFNLGECDGHVDLTWRHVVAVYNNKNWMLYVDGIFMDSEIHEIDIPLSSTGLKFGKNYMGKLDDIMFFSSALTEQDIEALFKL